LSVKKGSFSSQSTCPQGSLALQINKAGPPDSSSAALLLREHAKTARENSAINGQGRARPARGPRRPIHQQPRRRWALSSTAELALRPPTCGCSTGPRTSRPRSATTPSAEYRHTAHCLSEHRSSPARHKITGQGPATSRKQDSEQSSAQLKDAAHHSKQVRRPPCLPLRSSEDYCGGRPDVPDSLEVPH